MSDILSVLGTQVHYIRHVKSEAPTLLILHGWGGSISTWENCLQFFAKDSVSLLIFDLPGFGESPPPPTVWQLADYTACIKEALDQLGVKKCFLLGHSFGGQIATNLTSRYPEMFEHLFLVAAAAIRPPLSKKKRFIQNISHTLGWIFDLPLLNKLRPYILRALGMHDYLKVSSTPIMKETFKNVIRTDLTYLLDSIRVPTTVIWGENDTYTPLWQGEKIHSLIPHSQLFVLPNVKHGVHLQAPEKLHEIVIQTLTA